jgi:hypothetical protein
MLTLLALRPAPIGLILLLASSAWAQTVPNAPPVVGVIAAKYRPMVESTEINGRIQPGNAQRVVSSN